MAKQIKIRIKDVKAFRQWQKLKTASKAFERKLDELQAKAGLPTSKQFRRECKGYLVDGNGSPVAKFSVFNKPEFVMPACKVCRVS